MSEIAIQAGVLSKLEIKDGDVLVLNLPRSIMPGDAETIMRYFRDIGIDNKIIILEAGSSLEILSEAAA